MLPRIATVWEVCGGRGRQRNMDFRVLAHRRPGMWLRQFASREDALRFEQSPEVVMRPRDVVADDVAGGAAAAGFWKPQRS